jgi:hypothetical protein
LRWVDKVGRALVTMLVGALTIVGGCVFVIVDGVSGAPLWLTGQAVLMLLAGTVISTSGVRAWKRLPSTG